MIKLFLAIALSVSACSTPYLRGTGDSVIAGRVFVANDTAGLAGVQVAVVGTHLVTITDPRGRFVLRQPAAGLREIEFTNAVHPFRSPPLNLSSKDTIHVHATMESVSGARTQLPSRDPHACMVVECSPLPVDSSAMLVIDGVVQMPSDPVQRSSGEATVKKMVASIEILSGDAAIRLYGWRAWRGIVSVTTRR